MVKIAGIPTFREAIVETQSNDTYYSDGLELRMPPHFPNENTLNLE